MDLWCSTYQIHCHRNVFFKFRDLCDTRLQVQGPVVHLTLYLMIVSIHELCVPMLDTLVVKYIRYFSLVNFFITLDGIQILLQLKRTKCGYFFV